MNSSSASPIFAAQLIICVILFFPINQCRSLVIHPTDDNLLRQTCKGTPNYETCLFLLKYIGGEDIYAASPARMAEIMTDVVVNRTTKAYDKALELLKTTPNVEPLQACRDLYLFIASRVGPSVKGDVYVNVAGARDMMQKLVINKVQGCEDAYNKGNSELTEYNLSILLAASIAQGIINQL